MTQKHITPAAPLPRCAAGHSARLILDMRGPSAGGGHFVECCCRHTTKHSEADAALAEWRLLNRPPRSARKASSAAADAPGHNVVQLDFGSALASPAPRRAAGGRHGSR